MLARFNSSVIEEFRANGGVVGGPFEVHNVRANPNVHVEIGAESYDAVARELSGDERDSVYAKAKDLCPRILTYPMPARQIPVFELLRVSSLASPHGRFSP